MASPGVGALNCYRNTWAVFTCYLSIFHILGCRAREFELLHRTAVTERNDRLLISDDRFRLCLADLDHAARNGKVRPQDYKDFIHDYSDGKIRVDQFRELPSSLISKFNSIACSFCKNDDRYIPTSCCSGDLPYIELSIVSPDQLRGLCSAVDEISLNPSPSPSPSPSLSLSPTSDKSELPVSLIAGSTSVLISDEKFWECLTEMDQASFNGTLRAQDFNDFIRGYSAGKFDGFQFKELPSSLITEFNSLACTICTNDDYYVQTNCCSGNLTYIDLSTISPVNLRLLCTAVDVIYGTPIPTPPPESSPTKGKPTISNSSPLEKPRTAQPIKVRPSPSSRYPVTVNVTKKPVKSINSSPSSRYPMTITVTNKPIKSITSSPSVSDSPSPVLILVAPTKKPSTAKPTLSPTEGNAPSVAPSNSPRKTSTPTVSPSLRPRIKPIKKKSASAPMNPSAFIPSKASPALNVGENPTNDEKAALTNATSAAIDKILMNRGDSTELSSVSVSSVDDSRCIYPPSETLATKCLYINIEIEISVPPTVDAEKLKKSLTEELQKNPITFSS